MLAAFRQRHSTLLRRIRQPLPPPIRRYTTTPNKSPTPLPTSTQQQLSRADRILSRLPPSLQKYTTRLRGAPVSHVVAFLLLHEITAVVPLLALFGLFHYYADLVPLDWMMEHYGEYVRDGVGRFERYFARKGWFGFDKGEQHDVAKKGETVEDDGVLDRWGSAETKYRIVVEVALAYAFTKVLFPVRILASLGATPWFAAVLVKIQRLLPGRRRK